VSLNLKTFTAADLEELAGLKAEVIWVDPNDHFRAVVNVMRGSEIEKLEQTVFAIQFLNYWTLIKEGPPSS
jgi:hypothetical protein